MPTSKTNHRYPDKRRDGMSSIIIGAGAIAAKKALEKVAEDLYDFVSKQLGKKIKLWSTKRQIDKLYLRISHFRKVKTIWQIDKPVDIASFYCDAHFTFENKRKKIHQIADLPEKDNILIEGIAGQGKSILLRYLCIKELYLGNYIPVFIELRRITNTCFLKDRIFAEFEALGLTVDEDLFQSLLASGKILLFLDAFDEIPDELKSKVLTDIEDIAASKDNLRIIVTSRPNQSIRHSQHFTVTSLDNLRGNEFKEVICKLAKNEEWAKNLIDHIDTKAKHVKDLLCTPLMVTLLVMSYKSFQMLPVKLSDFYDGLFQMLLQRHDGTKPGYTRERSCDLDDFQYRHLFEMLCILAKKNGSQSFTKDLIYDLSKKVISECNLNENPDHYINDIVKITCLILREGEEYRFIHKTVQEYYTASFVQKRPEPWAQEFYKKIVDKKYLAEHHWEQELSFLSEIDVYRYNKYYLVPAILSFLNIPKIDLENPRRNNSQEDMNNFLKNVDFHLGEDGLRGMRHTPTSILYNDYAQKLFASLSLIRKNIRRKEFDEFIAKDPRKYDDFKLYIKTIDNKEFIPAYLLMGYPMFDDFFVPFTNKYCDELYEQAKSMINSMGVDENPSILNGLI